MEVAQPAAVLSMITQSDFVILTTLPKSGLYPFQQQSAQYWGDLKNWVEANMIAVRQVQFKDSNATIYVHPTATVSGLSGEWVTSTGLWIEAPRARLQRFPEIRLSGAANFSWLPKVPTISATIDTMDSPVAVPASLRRADDGYEILVDVSSRELPPSDPVRLHLSFDTFFVPKMIGMNDDTRELVFLAPSLIRLTRPGS
jgi:hypothetical protein